MAGGALAVALGVGILGSLALVWSQSASTPTARPLEVTVTGLPDESPVRIRQGNQIPNRSDGFVHAFDSAPVGTNDLTWVQGERCSLSDCPGAACPSWCFSKTTPIEVEPGEDSQAVAVDLAPPPKRVVRVQTPQLEKTWALDFTLGDHRGAAEEGAVVFTEVQPGAYTLRAQVGECPPEASNCWTDGDCPPGCSAYTGEFIVPWGEDEHTWDLEVTDPKPSRNANLRRTPEAPSPAPAPTSDGVASASTAVSHAGFASWLSQRPDWQKDAAVNAGRADKNYLAGWDGVTPPSAGAVKNVSWYAASAFCKSRGGLASVDAEPHRWAESPSQPYVEWRSDAGKAAWRSSDGRNSSKGIDLKTSNGVTGFRCAR